MLCYLRFEWGILVWNNINNINKNSTEGTGNSPAIYKNKIEKLEETLSTFQLERATDSASEEGDV
jgi:hypothetical protein